VAAKKGSAVIFSEALTHGAAPWVASHQRRTLLYRFAAQGFAKGGAVDFRESMTALGQAILEPAHYGTRPDIAALIAAEEAAETAASE
jgi:ectoine hydroxylase-related dioxygenase (phytanoyl-CoA dioxygenase family)